MQKKLAEILGVSTGQVSKLQNIDRRAIDEVKEALENDEISTSTAEAISKLDKDEQKKLMKEKPPSEIKQKDIPKAEKEKVTTNGNSSNDEDFTEEDDDESNDFPKDEESEEPKDGGLSDFKEDFGEKTPPKPKPKKTSSESDSETFYDYMINRKTLLYAILDTYLGITENKHEKKLIEDIKRFIK